MAFARSLAVSSMAGYVIGLGDRHCNNILLDSGTAELVHIDLGIAFEGGRYLPHPEVVRQEGGMGVGSGALRAGGLISRPLQVPFRLTRDLVDGLGATGVEGVMRRCCEAALQVMRSAHDALTTIIEVCVGVLLVPALRPIPDP